MTATPKLPDASIGAASREVRCRAKKSNGEPCGRERNAQNPNKCMDGHFWIANIESGKSTQRYLDEQRDFILPARDRHVYELGWTPETSTLAVLDYCTALAELPLALSHARRKRISEYTNLLLQYDRLLSRRETFKKPEPTTPFEEFDTKSNEEILAKLDSMRESLVHLMELKREQTQFAVPVTTPDVAPPSLHTRPNSESGVSVPTSTVPVTAGRQFSSPSDRDPGREFVSSLPPPAPREPDASDEDREPIVYVYNRRVTSQDVRNCLRDSGDIEAYDVGRISKYEAYRETQTWLRNLKRMPR